jgi:hypothetical protein
MRHKFRTVIIPGRLYGIPDATCRSYRTRLQTRQRVRRGLLDRYASARTTSVKCCQCIHNCRSADAEPSPLRRNLDQTNTA